ncbi:hypothetical protein D3C84_589190 [compost metagenome]
MVGDDQAVFVLRMIEVEKQTLTLQQAQDEIQIALAVLRDVAVGPERLLQTELEPGQHAIVGEHRAQDVFDGLLLKDPRVEASRQHPQPGAQGGRIVGQATVTAVQAESTDVAMNVTCLAARQLNLE